MTKQLRVALYARFSSNLQREASIEDQYRVLEQRAATEKWRVVGRYADKAMAGARTDRPDYLRMLTAAKRKEFDVLLTEGLDRLFRNLAEQERVLNRLEHDGLRIVGLNDHYDTTDEERGVSRAFHGVKNERYSKEQSKRTHRSFTGQVLKGFRAGGRPYGYRLVKVFDGTRRDQFGERVKIGTHLAPDKAQAKIVLEIYRRYADGESERGIATALNARKVPSPGEAWQREVRRASGWQGSAVRVILRNEIYAGRYTWNKSKWVKDPDTGVRERKERPKAEWMSRDDDSMRIVPAPVIARVQRRIEARAKLIPGRQACANNRARYLLSGLLVCAECKAHYILCSKTQYACGSFIGGGKPACKNHWRINRKETEKVILGEMRRKLLAPKVVAQMKQEAEQELEKRLRLQARQYGRVPKAVQELTKRIERLKVRLKNGDADLAPDELQAAIDTAERKKLELMHDSVQGRTPVLNARRFYAALPNLARAYERQIEKGLDGNPEQAAKAREILREIVGGKIWLRPTPRGVVARSPLHSDVLIRAAEMRGGKSPRGLSGSGGRI